MGRIEQLRITLAARLPEDDCQQVDTSALPVRHPSRVRGPDGWTAPGNDLAARFGRDAAHAEVVLRLPARRENGRGQPDRPRPALVPAAMNEGEVAGDMLLAGPHPRDLLTDKGFNGRPFAASQAAHGTAILVLCGAEVPMVWPVHVADRADVRCGCGMLAGGAPCR